MANPCSPRAGSASPTFRTDEVLAHYEALSPSYAARANQACSRACAQLIARSLANATRVLEVGAGSRTLLPRSRAPFHVACDLSLAMLLAPPASDSSFRVAADAQAMPFRDAAFDGLYTINVLEHLPQPALLIDEAARVLASGGRFVSVTPNGDVAWLLDQMERLRVKLPEGPHRFLRFDELAALADLRFRVIEHRRFLAFPVGPPRFVNAVDRIVGLKRGRGLFQFIVMERTGEAASGSW